MYAFTYWHTYYDSAFLNMPLKLSNALHLEYKLSQCSLKIGQKKAMWPTLLKLPQLSRMFELLQTLISSDVTYNASICQEQNHREMEMQLNILLINMQCQKKYGWQFWSQSVRRIQSSAVHFFLFLKMWIQICLPKDCQNLGEAKAKGKLMLRISEIEVHMFFMKKFVNEIVKIVKPVHLFMFQNEYFREEKALTLQFFDQLTVFLRNLPKYKRSMLLEVPKLMEYICLVNPSETSRQPSPEASSSPRGRNITDVDKNRKNDKDNSEEKDSLQKSPRDNKIDLTKNIKNIKKVNKDIQTNKVKNVTETLNLFRFKDRPKSVSIKSKSPQGTNTSLTRDRTDYSRSPTQDRTYSIFQDNSKIKRTDTYAENRLKDNSLSISVEGRTRQKSALTVFSMKKAQKLIETQELEEQRGDKVKKKKVSTFQVKTTSVSRKMDFNEGKAKGWAFLRQWFNSRLARRKLSKLLEL